MQALEALDEKRRLAVQDEERVREKIREKLQQELGQKQRELQELERARADSMKEKFHLIIFTMSLSLDSLTAVVILKK